MQWREKRSEGNGRKQERWGLAKLHRLGWDSVLYSKGIEEPEKVSIHKESHDCMFILERSLCLYRENGRQI